MSETLCQGEEKGNFCKSLRSKSSCLFKKVCICPSRMFGKMHTDLLTVVSGYFQRLVWWGALTSTIYSVLLEVFVLFYNE